MFFSRLFHIVYILVMTFLVNGRTAFAVVLIKLNARTITVRKPRILRFVIRDLFS